METRQITTEQIENVKNWKGEFQAQPCDEGIRYTYNGSMSADAYCEFLRMDFSTVSLLGGVSYAIEYNCIEGNKYVLKCETYIDNFINGKLSFELEDDEDYLGFYGETGGDIGVARWLPSNWKELMSDEQKEEVAKEWCKDNSAIDLLTDSEKEEVAYDYMDESLCTCASHCYEKMGSYEQKDFLKECIDNL